jgi:uncharacterized protein YceK
MVVLKRCWLLVLLVLLSGCALFRPDYRIQPVTVYGGSANTIAMTLESNTNCAEIGEEVVLTLTITNAADTPFTMVEPLDIILRPMTVRGKQTPAHRWSETAQYPPVIPSVFAPKETRTYEWRWQAAQQFGDDHDRRENGVDVLAIFTYERTPGVVQEAGAEHLIIGVTDHPEADGWGIPCSSFTR